jgi:hypothetical protein
MIRVRRLAIRDVTCRGCQQPATMELCVHRTERKIDMWAMLLCTMCAAEIRRKLGRKTSGCTCVSRLPETTVEDCPLHGDTK